MLTTRVRYSHSVSKRLQVVLLYRYTAIGRRQAVQPAFHMLLGIVDEVLPIERWGHAPGRGDRVWKRKAARGDSLLIAVKER